ncbi:hypothetical protein [Candidatus Albibeggiatoa sp. nov. NOAA]|uniref:hypothetical protein n=1 Tax=Candidatus Albibeggiatoa sp. nov. NOAA TaxID=3162724 RepID=UPI0033008A4B|nr:hypothetical protein [Thiotrichaceae bacterium]
MSWFSNLLSGAVTVGKVAMAVASALPVAYVKRDVESDTEFSVSGPSSAMSCGVHFFRSNANPEKEMKLYAGNPNSQRYVQLSMDSDREEVYSQTITLPPYTKHPFKAGEDVRVSPETIVNTGFITGSGDIEDGSFYKGGDKLFRLTLKNLNLKNVVKVGKFTISMNTQQLFIVTSGLVISGISSMYIKTNDGVGVNSNLRLSAKKEDKDKFSFNIDYSALGIEPTHDTIRGNLILELDSDTSDEMILQHSSELIEPLHEVEKEFFLRHHYS